MPELFPLRKEPPTLPSDELATSLKPRLLRLSRLHVDSVKPVPPSALVARTG